MAGMPALPQGDKTLVRRKAPKVGPDDNPKTEQAGRSVVPNLPRRDGPAKDAPNGKIAGKPPTSAKAKTSKGTLASMKASLKKVR